MSAQAPEPAGTRMQVVKGASELTFGYLLHRLPPGAERKECVLHWPKWLAGRWVTEYRVDDLPGVRLDLWPDGRYVLYCYDDAGLAGDATAGQLDVASAEPARDCFNQIGARYADAIVATLTERTKP